MGFHLDVGIGDAVMEPLEIIEGRDWLGGTCWDAASASAARGINTATLSGCIIHLLYGSGLEFSAF